MSWMSKNAAIVAVLSLPKILPVSVLLISPQN